MLPAKEQAEDILREGETMNPGPWGDHSRTVAHCAYCIAKQANMDANKAYVVGLLHDIGRRFGKRNLGHVIDGYRYMMELGYDEAAKICLTHSFNLQSIDNYVGKRDTTKEETEEIITKLAEAVFDDYDRLIQLCDAIAGAGYIMNIVDRMNDVKSRYGSYPQDKWDCNIYLKSYFEEKIEKNLYEVVSQKKFHISFDKISRKV